MVPANQPYLDLKRFVIRLPFENLVLLIGLFRTCIFWFNSSNDLCHAHNGCHSLLWNELYSVDITSDNGVLTLRTPKNMLHFRYDAWVSCFFGHV